MTSLRYLRPIVSDEVSKYEILSRIAEATAAQTKLKPLQRDNNISLGTKVKLMCSLGISIFLYACESWTLMSELEKRMQAFEMRYFRRLLNISYKDQIGYTKVRKGLLFAKRTPFREKDFYFYEKDLYYYQ